MYEPMSILKKPQINRQKIGIFLCIFSSITWSILPLIGWSSYSLQDNHIICSAELYEKSLNVISYNIFTFIIVFLIPEIVIIITNYKLLKMVFKLIES